MNVLKHLQFIQKIEKLLLWCAHVAKWDEKNCILKLDIQQQLDDTPDIILLVENVSAATVICLLGFITTDL